MKYTTIAALLILLIAIPVAVAEEGDDETQDRISVDLGIQDVSLDADDAGEARFMQFQDQPSGLVLNDLSWDHSSAENQIRIHVKDATQKDESFALDGRVGDHWRFRGGLVRTPYMTGGGARLPLGRAANDEFGASFRIADFVQQAMQDPDGNGTPFYTDGTETAADNALVFGMTNDLLDGLDDFFVGTERESMRAGFTFQPDTHWTVDFDVFRDSKDGTQAMGAGTYQRISDINADGITDYDYYFSVRGIELPAPVDFRTTRFVGSADYQKDRWNFSARTSFSEFENEYLGVTYDNPFWFTDTTGGGALRGLSEQGRASLAPSNKAWDFTLSGGVNLPHRTRITALVSVGEHTQDARFLPITTNTAAIGVADLNGDGLINAADDPTSTAVFGSPFMFGGERTIGNNLDGSVDTTMYNLTVTSRPTKKLKLLGRFRSYEYEGQEGILAVQGRTEYIESRIKTDFKNDTILHVPQDYTRDTLDLQADYRVNRSLKLRGFFKMVSYDYDQYRVDPLEPNATRDAGSRAVSGTDDDRFGISAMFRGNDWFSGSITAYTSDRTYDGDYTPAFDGENQDVRQFDIAERETDGVDVSLDFVPSDSCVVSLGYRYSKDDFPETDFGMQQRDVDGYDLSVNYAANEKVNVFLFADYSEWDSTMHLATKCSNCSAPDPLLAPWNIPGYDWYADYTDTTTALGFGIEYDSGNRAKFDFHIDLTDGEIEQKTTNLTIPMELNPLNPLFGDVAQVALGFDFPDQTQTSVNVNARWTHKLSANTSAGLMYAYQDFDLDDFQLDGLDSYGANFLDVDDATRYLLLGSRIGDYTAHIGQVFVKSVW